MPRGKARTATNPETTSSRAPPIIKNEEIKEEEVEEEDPKSTPSILTPALDSKDLRMSYRIARGEQGVLTFEPYKSALLPLWRFRTVPIARESAAALWERFEAYGREGDFVGMDMTRKYIQMGMTRAGRYANYKGGRKYLKGEDGERGEQKSKSEGHEGQAEKREASNVFRGYWERAKENERYLQLKEEFVKEQKDWDKMQKKS